MSGQLAARCELVTRTMALRQEGAHAEVRKLLEPLPDSLLREEALLGRSLALAYMNLGEPAKASAWLETLLADAAVRPRDRAARLLHMNRGTACFFMGETGKAREWYERAYEIALEDGDDYVAALSSQNLGALYGMAADYLVAFGYLNRALAYHQRTGSARGVAQTHANAANGCRAIGDIDAAEAHLDRAFALQRASVDIGLHEGRLLASRAKLSAQRRDFDFAYELAQRALRTARRAGIPAITAETYRTVGIVAVAKGRYRTAAKAFASGASLASGLKLESAEFQEEEAVLAVIEGRTATAEQHASSAEAIYRALSFPLRIEKLRRRLHDPFGEPPPP